MANQTPQYRTLLAFITSLSYTDFSTIQYEAIREVLESAGVPFQQEGFIVDVYPYTTPGLGITFELVQETGHRNAIYLTFNEQGVLSDFHLKTSL